VTRRRQADGSRTWTRSSSHWVTGIRPGSAPATAREPVKRRWAPGSRARRVAPSTASHSSPAPPATTPARSRARRDRSVRRGRAPPRAAACQASRGSATRAAPTWTCMALTGPSRARAPPAWASPAATATSTSTPKATDAHRPAPDRLARPRRTTTDFQGARTSTASPARPWATTTGRPQPVPAANASPPVARATTSMISRARLVRRGPMLTLRLRSSLWRRRRPQARGRGR
jgi:hypothetical protein